MAWTYRTADDQIFDGEYDTMHEADNAAQEAFCEECEKEGCTRNQLSRISLLEFEMDEKTGERKILQSVKSIVEWQYNRSDREEHGYP